MFGEHIQSLFILVQSNILNSIQSSSFFIPQFFKISSCSFLDVLTLLISIVLIIFLERSIILNSNKISLTTLKQLSPIPNPLKSTRSTLNSPFFEFFIKNVFRNSYHPTQFYFMFISRHLAVKSLFAKSVIFCLFT